MLRRCSLKNDADSKKETGAREIVLIATAQSLISRDVRENGNEIRSLMHEAKASSARVVHFPEGALSGYIKAQIKSWDEVDWSLLDSEIEIIKQLAKDLQLWVVFGCNHQGGTNERPYNDLYVISDEGTVHGRYSKRLISHTEITDWYTPGNTPLVFELDGISFGCLLCIEIQYPELFMEYERLGIDCLLFSAYSKSPVFATQAQGHAACNSYWLSFSVPTNTSENCASRFIGPEGSVLSACPNCQSGLIVNKIDPKDPKWVVPIKHSRPWRRRARSGEIYAEST